MILLAGGTSRTWTGARACAQRLRAASDADDPPRDIGPAQIALGVDWLLSMPLDPVAVPGAWTGLGEPRATSGRFEKVVRAASLKWRAWVEGSLMGA